MARGATLTTLIGWMIASVSVAAAADVAPASQKAKPAGSLSVLLEGLTVKVGTVRTWTTFDGKTPAMKADERWVSGAINLVNLVDPFVGSSRLASGTRQMSQGADSYAATVESFSAKEAPKASGRFCEVAVLLANAGAAPRTVSLLDATSKTLEALLLPPAGTPVPLRAFLVPGVGAAETSLVKSFEGKLAVSLAPGEESWALLVFDVPVGQNHVRLQIKKTATLAVRLP